MERINARVLEDYAKVITQYVVRQNGVYALYKGDRLYYVGLAKNLKSRLRAHLRDRHKGAWDSFSVYLTETNDHLRELEALVLRIVLPEGNKQVGKLQGSEDMGRLVTREFRMQRKAEEEALFGRKRVLRSTRSEVPLDGDMAKLAKHLALPLRLRGWNNGVLHKAVLRRDGQIRFGGSLHTSLSMAARTACGRSSNGWHFWHFRNAHSDWVRLSTIPR